MLNLTFINSVQRDPSKIVHLYLTFPSYILATCEKYPSVECTVDNSSLALVVLESKAGVPSRFKTYESKLEYNFRYLPFASLKIVSKEISLEINFI